MYSKPQIPADLVKFTEEVLFGKFNFFMQCFLNTLQNTGEYWKTLNKRENYNGHST